MILTDNLSASWDGPSQALVMHGTEPTRLQNIALQLSQKISAVSDMNDRIAHEQQANKLYSSYRNNNNWRGGGQGGRGGYQNRGGRGGGYSNRGGRSGYDNQGGDRRNDNRDRDGQGARGDGRDGQKREYTAY